MFSSAASVITAYADDRLCISQIKAESGDNAAEKLEGAGYTVLYQNLNPSDGERIYLGYKLGKTAVTGLVVSSEYKSSLSVDSVSYLPVSSLNLNQGTDGSPVYLYSTTDAKAGSGIVSLAFAKDDKDKKTDLLESINDGSVPVRTATGKAADFDEGISERDLYLLTVREKACLPYISEVKIVNVGSDENSFGKIVSSGCNYFCIDPIAETDRTVTYLCYNRTDDVSDAVRFAAASDSEVIDGITYQSAGSYNLNGETVTLYFTKDGKVGNPVSEIVKGSFVSGSFSLGDWAKSYFSGAPSSARSGIYGEEAYSALIESDTEYIQLQIKSFSNGQSSSATDLYMILPAEGLAADAPEEKVIILETEQQSDEELQRDTEVTGIEKEVTAETENDSVNAYGSVIGVGSLISIAAMAVIAVVIASIFVTIKAKKKKEN